MAHSLYELTNLSDVRESLDWTQDQLALKAKVTSRTVSVHENGGRMRHRTLKKYELALGEKAYGKLRIVKVK